MSRTTTISIAIALALLPITLPAMEDNFPYTDWVATPIDSTIVDAVQNCAPMNNAPGCGAEWAMIGVDNPIPEGLYAIAISEGPGLSGGGDYDVGCFVLISGPTWYLGGLHGYGSASDPRSFIVFRVGPGETRQVHLCIADGDCRDNDGWVKVRLYSIGN